MLDNLRNLSQLPAMLAKAKQLQEEVKKLQAEAATRIVEAEAGGGLVRASVSGQLQVLRVRVDRARLGAPGADGKVALGAADLDALEDTITAAIAAGQRQAAEALRLQMEKAAADAGISPEMLGGMAGGGG